MSHYISAEQARVLDSHALERVLALDPEGLHHVVVSQDISMCGWDRAPGADLEHSRVVLLFGFDHLETDGSPVWQNRVYAEGRSYNFV